MFDSILVGNASKTTAKKALDIAKSVPEVDIRIVVLYTASKRNRRMHQCSTVDEPSHQSRSWLNQLPQMS